jgi:hypothetical protein
MLPRRTGRVAERGICLTARYAMADAANPGSGDH